MSAAIDFFQHLPKPCTKIGYGSKQTAKIALRTLASVRRHQESERCENHAYHCHCGRWHLTGLTHDAYKTLTRRLSPRQHGLRNQAAGVCIR